LKQVDSFVNPGSCDVARWAGPRKWDSWL